MKHTRYTLIVSVILSLCFLASILYSCRFSSEKKQPMGDWYHTGYDEGGSKYSPLDQINKSNVANLQQAWVYHSGDTRGNVQMNPIIIKGVMYITTPGSELIALNAASGKEIWRFNPARSGETLGGINRGVAFWAKADDERILYTSGEYLNAVNAKTGKAIASFGDSGRISLNEGLVRPASDMKLTSPASPVIFEDIVIVGGLSWSAPSNVSGFDVQTGERKWIFHTIPHPGEEGFDTWEDKNFWKEGAGVNVWGGLSVDTQNGLVFFCTGQPKDDFYRPANQGAHLYGNSIVALDARTGKKVWHYQVIHHDLWDLDLPCTPIIADLYQNGKKVPGVVQLTKTGNVFLFNRLTGEVLSKVEERPVSQSSLPGEYAYPTQPYVSWPEPFSRQVLTEQDITRRTPEVHVQALEVFRNADTGWFVPPSVKGILYFGIHGGAEWGGGAYDPATDRIYINSNELAWHIVMRDINAAEGTAGDFSQHPGRKIYFKSGCISCHGGEREGMGAIPKLIGLNKKYEKPRVVEIIQKGKGAMPAFSQIPKDDIEALADFLLDIDRQSDGSYAEKKPLYRALAYTKFLDKDNYPAITPPWGTLNAINLKTGKLDWTIPFGEYPELTAKGIPLTGTENFGGPIVTKGGLIFIGATRDEKFRAYDKDTGRMLWETTLPFGGYAVPSTYAVDGKQYVVIAATGGGKLGTKTGDAYVAFTLPDDK